MLALIGRPSANLGVVKTLAPRLTPWIMRIAGSLRDTDGMINNLNGSTQRILTNRPQALAARSATVVAPTLAGI